MALTTQYKSAYVLPIVKAYPNLSRQYGEVSCIAALTLPDVGRSQWLRLYPVPFRTLDAEQKFKKYQPITVEVAEHSGDTRPESRRVNADSIQARGQPIGTERGWASRRSIVEPTLDESMCAIQRSQETTRQSLGIFRPAEVLELVIDPVEPDPEKGQRAAAWAAQPSLFGGGNKEQERKALEQIPYRFSYRYRCSEPHCNGHKQSIVDWELAQFFRRERKRPGWEERVRGKWLDELCASSRDTAFIVGNQHQHPRGFLVLGVWYPPRQAEQLGLSELPNF